MRVALDTNRYSDWALREPTITELVATSQRLYLPFIVVAELKSGFLRGNKPAKNLEALSRFVTTANVTVLHSDQTTIDSYAELIQQLRTQGTPIPTNDIWIAAVCLCHGLTLATRDAHFSHIPQLQTI